MLLADDWKDYELLDTSAGEKLERFGEYMVIRPDPQIIWRSPKTHEGWKQAQLHYHRSHGSGPSAGSVPSTGGSSAGSGPSAGGGSWEMRQPVPERWQIGWGDLKFHIRPTDFKHMGIFPEQAVNWRWIMDKLSAAGKNAAADTPLRVLNLFAYTGGATLAAAAAGAEVCHVDAAKAMNGWAKENLALSGLAGSKVRFLADDVMKFVAREQRRGNRYDAIIMDPPAYGRGPKGELWKLENELAELIAACAGLLSAQPVFMLVNVYTAGLSPVALENLLRLAVPGGEVSSGELGLRSATGPILPCGIYGRWNGAAQKA